jgi:hypothetical protein
MAGRNGTKRDRVKKKKARARTGEMEDRLGRLAHRMQIPYGRNAKPMSREARIALQRERVRG